MLLLGLAFVFLTLPMALPLIVSGFLQRHPESRVKLEVRNTATIAAMLARYEIDLGLVEGQVVDGELFSWYGSRLLGSAEYFAEVVK